MRASCTTPKSLTVSASEIPWAGRPVDRSDLCRSDDDVRWERDFFRAALSVAVGLLHDTTAQLARERQAHRYLRERLLEEAGAR